MAGKSPARIRKVTSGAAFALLVTCIFAGAANAMPQAAAGASDKPATTTATPKPTTAKPGAKKTTTSAKSHSKLETHSSSGKSSTTTHKVSSKGKKKTSSKRVRGQQKIDSERAQSIQEALIREHYLSGEPTGTWNQASEDAMRKYQADHGWQSKQVPDSRALIKLGLGPSKEHLLNPESAMTTVPDAPRAASLEPVSHSADPGPPASKRPASETPTSAPADASRPQ